MDYANGKIYAVRSPNMEMYYIGSCITKLEKRFYRHKQEKKCTSRIVIDAGDSYIELIENFPCNSKIELNKREGELQRQYKNDIVNRQIVGRTREEYAEDHKEHIAEYQKEYREDNKEHIVEYQKEYRKQHYEDNKEPMAEYREKNKEHIAEQTKQYYEDNKEQRKQYLEDNKEQIAEQQKQYREDNKEKIKQYQKEYYQKKKLEKENNNI